MQISRYLVLLLTATLPSHLKAQDIQTAASATPVEYLGDSLLSDFSLSKFSPFGFLLTYFPSEFIRNGLELKSYIGSERFLQLRRRFGDLRAVDAIYIRALHLTEGNTAMALWYCALASMDHRIVGIRIPFLKLFFPLSNESEEEFTRRVENLPTHFYADAPQRSTGDRDKLQHFFGSAFVANLFESRDAADRVGRFIEWGEDTFIVDGAYDERDMRANRQGHEFGIALLSASRDEETRSHPLPSNFLSVQLARDSEPQVSSAVGEGTQLCGVW